MKKICFIQTYAYPLFNKNARVVHGGAELQTYLLANELKQKNNVDYIVGDFGQQNVEFFNGIRVIKYFKPLDSQPSQIIKLINSLFKSNSDFYIQRGLNRGTLIISLFCKLLRKKFIFMISHDSQTDDSFKRSKDLFSRVISDFGLRFSSVIICQSSEEKENLLSFKKIPSKKIRILKKGLQLSEQSYAHKKEIDAIWVGRCEKWKRPELFLHLADQNKDKNFLMVCSPSYSDPLYFEKIREKASQILNLGFEEKIPNNEVVDLFKNSKTFILTSLSEGELPMTALEAFSCGTPIISVHINPENVITSEKIGVFLNGDEEKLNTVFCELEGDCQKMIEYSRSSIEYVRRERDINKISEKFEKILLEL
ncbi:Glycosyltransferase [Methanosarcina sp. MTP4]|uniref:glycosyltransferase family 4 protein n=1 Tax=Methanosarcina sp. MTP4 TaxID=1434100 RepID=UPI0006161E26|nr:glycosyltransferase family 4 protein [Methanosarcina sp. MTP4]AKB24331.1 Glycosyltransferase [Methanosarcina sp. MTP4]